MRRFDAIVIGGGLVGTAIGHGDEIGRPLQRHLEILDLAEIALEAAAGAARGLDHDVDEG